MRKTRFHLRGSLPGILLFATILLWPTGHLISQDDADSTDLLRTIADTLLPDPPDGLYGSVGASLIAYDIDGLPARREPLSWTVDGSLNATLLGFDIPIDFTLSEQERSFRQPFNRIGFSPGIGPLRTHLGYRSMRFSDYTLAGVTFLGGGVELAPGGFRLMGMYGRLQRAVEEDTTEQFVLPAYERWGYGAKIGYESTIVDVGVSYFHAWDDSSSLVRRPTTADVRPQENSVAGLTLGFAIIPERLRIEAEAGASILTRDVGSIPSDTNDIPGEINSIQTVRNSTTLTLATKAGLEYLSDDFRARLGYERIEPEYESLGAYYFTTDVERFTLEPAVNLFDRRLRLSGSIGLEHDNLLDNRLARTNRVIGSALVGWDPSQTFGIDASYLNYSTGQSAGRERINDTIAVRNVSQSASLAPRLLFVGPATNHFITLVGMMQDYTDRNAFTNELSDSRTVTGNLIYSLSFVETPLTTGASLLLSETTTGAIVTTAIGGSLNGGLGFSDGDLSLTGSVGYTRTSQDFNGVATSANVFNENLNAAYRLTDNDQISLSAYATQSDGNLSLSSDFEEMTAVLSYRHSFSIGGDDDDE